MVDCDREWDELPIAELEQLDAVCVRFDLAMAHDPEVRIESFVIDLTEPQQRLVVLELVQVEIERRHAGGQHPTPDEYALRFPQWADELHALAAQSVEDLDRAGLVASPETVSENASTDNDTKSQFSRVLPPAGAETSEADASWADQRRALASGMSWADLPHDGVLGHYRLQRVIGRGGMGLIVRARDTKLSREVAIKLLAPETSHDADAKERFLREARAVAVIRHNHVVTIHAVEEINGIPFLVMELVDGTNLEEYLGSSGKLPTGEVASLAYQVAQGLAAAHKQGLIHRDVKPANILLEKNDQHGSGLPQQTTWNVKITDFGLARVAAESRLTNSGLIAGTPQYMSPEQANGEELDPRSDLFSLGSVMYSMCTGRAPFEAESAIGIVRQVADKPAHPLRELTPETPGWLIAIIDKLMAKVPDERFQSADEVAELLARHVRDFQAGPSLTPSPPRFVGERVGVRGLRLRSAALITLTIVGIAAVAIFFGKLAYDSGAADQSGVASVKNVDVETKQPWHGWPADAPAPAIAPFDTEQASAHQEAWAKYLGILVETVNSIDMKMVLIPPGEFLMGTADEDIHRLIADNGDYSFWSSVAPQHRVTITQPFLMGACEVTRGQFRAFVEDTKYVTEVEQDGKGGYGMRDGKMHQDPTFMWSVDPGFAQTDDHPVLNVSWTDARAFCEWLSKKESIAYRLPTEAQWEYACRAGTTTPWHCGDSLDVLHEYAWLDEGWGGRTHPVGQLQPNPWTLYDMHGNVWEWCADRFDEAYYRQSPEVDPAGPDHAPKRLYRGGGWLFTPDFCRSAIRYWHLPSHRGLTMGFRVTADLPSQSAGRATLDSAGR